MPSHRPKKQMEKVVVKNRKGTLISTAVTGGTKGTCILSSVFRDVHMNSQIIKERGRSGGK
jgi:hypothetical protein